MFCSFLRKVINASSLSPTLESELLPLQGVCDFDSNASSLLSISSNFFSHSLSKADLYVDDVDDAPVDVLLVAIITLVDYRLFIINNCLQYREHKKEHHRDQAT